MSALHRLAAAGPVPLFPALGLDARERVENLGLEPDVEFAATPRHARVLLVAGSIRPADREALEGLHDQLPHPRATLCWGAEAPPGFQAPVTVAAESDPVPVLTDLHRQLLSGARSSEAPLRPDEPPAPWRGLGDFGQGGEGMMGGTPYGRPMPMPPEDDLRDGLSLDTYTATWGPFLSQWPPGLAMELTLQGDVLQRAAVIRPPLPVSADAAALFRQAWREPVAMALMERSRAGHHLRCVARLVHLLQLDAIADRCRRAARLAGAGEPVDIAALRRMLRRAGAFSAIPGGLGRLAPDVARELGGVAGRAAGAAVDARAETLAYTALGFLPLTQAGSDVRARLAQWLDEADQALRLADHGSSSSPIQAQKGIESPWGPLAPPHGKPPPPVEFAVTELLTGLEWSEAALVLASFDTVTLDRMVPGSPRRDSDAEE